MAGFEMRLTRKIYHYIITYYLPSAMFVSVSWISFLIPPDNIPGRMALLITVFLVLVNIFNTITINIPKTEGLTAIETYLIICVLFVFGALLGKEAWHLECFYRCIVLEYAGILLQRKMKVSMIKPTRIWPHRKYKVRFFSV